MSKAKNNKGDFVYAPKANANVEDAALKVVGRECALQCDRTALEMGGFELHAFLPKPTAIGLKVTNHSAFISVDSRPVSATRGTLKKIAAAVRDRLRKANLTVANTKDPFFCMNIICPVDSYDPNIEPAKDDVIFSDEDFIVALIDRLLVSYYPEDISSAGPIGETDTEDMVDMQPTQIPDIKESLPRSYTPFSVHQDRSFEETKVPSSAAQSQEPRWRSTMYGVDKEDLEFLQENAPVAAEEEEGCHDAAISNPWTIARMNAPVRSKKPVSNGQLLSPAKSQGDTSTAPQSPAPAATPRRSRPIEPLTPQTSSQTKVHGDRLNEELRQSIQRLPRPASPHVAVLGRDSGPRTNRAHELPSFEERMSLGFVNSAPRSSVFDTLVADIATPRRNPRSRQPFRNKSFVPPAPQSDTWFGQPMRNVPKVARPHKRSRQRGPAFFPNEDSFSSQRLRVLPAAGRLVETRLASENNTDIRDFLGKSRRAPADVVSSVYSRGSRPQHIADQLRAYAEQESPKRSSPSRPQSADSYQCSTDTARKMNAVFQLHQNVPPDPISNPIRRGRPPGITPAPEPAPAPRPRRRQTTDGGFHRTKSCTLPLNFIPHGFETHNLSFPLTSSVLSITQQARKLDIKANSLEWGYDSTEAFDVFSTRISERKIMEWVSKVDGMLHAVLERVDGVEVRGALHEGIQRFLDTRREEEEEEQNSIVRAANMADRQTAVFADHDHVSPGVDGSVGRPSRGSSYLRSGGVPQAEDGSGHVVTHAEGKTAVVGAAVELDGYEEDVDFSQFVDLDGGAGRQGLSVRIDKIEDDLDDGVDDEMLMDL